MSSTVNRIAIWGALGVWLAAPAVAQDAAVRPGEDRWIPGLGITGGITFQQQDSSVASSCAVGGAGATGIPACSGGVPPGPGVLRPSDDDTDWAVSPYVGVDAQLMTPALPIPTRPRLFLRGEVLPTFAVTRSIANEGDATGLEPPVFGGTGRLQPPINYPEPAVSGQGSKTDSTVETLAFGADVGVAFPFELRGRQLRIKPSFGWLRYEVKVDGTVHRAIKNDRPTGNGAVIRDCTFLPDSVLPTSVSCAGVALSGTQSQWFNGIGPGLELEMDAFRAGPIGASLFLNAHGYRILGEREVRFSESVNYPNPVGGPPAANQIPADTYTANWSFEVHPWMYRAGVGIRFQWLGY